MTIGFAAACVLTAAAAAATDLSWVVDADLPVRMAAAETEATRLEALAAQRNETRRTVIAKRQAALKEKGELEADLAGLSRGKKSEAEARIAALARDAEQADARAKALASEAAALQSQALAQRTFAATLAVEAKARKDDEASNAIPAGADLTQISDAKLRAARAWHQRRIDRVPKQLAALDAELDGASGVSDRGAVVERKGAVRAAASAEQGEIDRIGDELRFRADSKTDDATAAAQLDAAARAKASENATPAASPGSTPDHIDAALDRILAKQDREAADAIAHEKTTRTFVRFAAAVGGFGALALILVFALKGRGVA